MAERLHHATAEGRLTAVELEQRLEVLYRTRTYDELDALVGDLPLSTPARARGVRFPVWVAAGGALAVLLMVLGLLGVAARHSTVVIAGPRGPGQFRIVPPLQAHQLMIAAASRVAAFAVLVVCVVLIWRLMRARGASGT